MCVRVRVCVSSTPPLSTLSPYLEPDWLLQMARLRRSLLYPILPPLSVGYREFTHVVRGSIVACPHAELPRLSGGSGCSSSRLRRKSRKKGSRQPTAMFQILSVFYRSSTTSTGVKQPRYAVTSRAEKMGVTGAPSVRLDQVLPRARVRSGLG